MFEVRANRGDLLMEDYKKLWTDSNTEDWNSELHKNNGQLKWIPEVYPLHENHNDTSYAYKQYDYDDEAAAEFLTKFCNKGEIKSIKCKRGVYTNGRLISFEDLKKNKIGEMFISLLKHKISGYPQFFNQSPDKNGRIYGMGDINRIFTECGAIS